MQTKPRLLVNLLVRHRLSANLPVNLLRAYSRGCIPPPEGGAMGQGPNSQLRNSRGQALELWHRPLWVPWEPRAMGPNSQLRNSRGGIPGGMHCLGAMGYALPGNPLWGLAACRAPRPWVGKDTKGTWPPHWVGKDTLEKARRVDIPPLFPR